MSQQSLLNSYIHQLQQRLRLGAALRGAAILFAAALVTTIILVLILNAYAFPAHGLFSARAALVLLLGITALAFLALPLLRLNKSHSVTAAEAARPEFQQRLLTFHEREQQGNDPFLELLAADTLSVAEDAPPTSYVPNNKLLAFIGAGLGSFAVLVWMITAGPGFLGYGAGLLWTGPKHNVAPLYDLRVTPGNIAVRRNSDQLITAQIIGLKPEKVQLFARYQSAVTKSGSSAAWEPVAMQPAANAVQPGTFQFLFAGLPENVEYYVTAGPITSQHYKVRVADLPSVKQVSVTYHYPKWTGLHEVSEEHSGDLRAIEGTDAELEVLMSGPLRDGMLTLDDGKQVHLTGGEGNHYKGTIHMAQDGAYHVAATDEGQSVRLSEDYFIATNKANPPNIAIDRPGRDYRASPIEEVTIGVKADDEFALNQVNLHYSVNGGPDHTVNMLKQAGAKTADGKTTLSLEDFKLVPGDLVSLYATAKDGHAEARTEITFIQADPYEREFSQSQQGGGGGGGGGGQGNQSDISKREKELIAATWKQQNDKATTPKEAADAGKFLSDVQNKLRDQVLALSGRMQSRDLSTANEEFTSFEKDMQSAAAAMQPSSKKLEAQQWPDAIPAEQKALQYLLRAEATFRQIQVAFGQRGGGGGGGGGNAGRDLASLFDLEMDTQKNQYESAQTASAADEHAKAVDDALAKLDALAKRQEELAQQQRKAAQTFEERWKQEMLRREAEQLQKQMEQLAQNSQQNGQQNGSQSSSQSGQSSGSQSPQSQSQSGQSQSGQSGSSQSQASARSSSSQGQSQAQSRAGEAGTDPRVTQALNRLRQAGEDMKHSSDPQQGSEAAQRAADQLRQASGLLGGVQQQQGAGKLDSLAHEADRLSKEEKQQANHIRDFAAGKSDQAAQNGQNGQAGSTSSPEARRQELGRIVNDRQQLSNDLDKLQKGLRDSARELAPSQPGAASKLRDAVNGLDQSDLTNLTQRTSDWLRGGINPNSNGTEGKISAGLDQLSQQVQQAQQSMGAAKSGQGRGQRDQGEQTAALDHVERLRSQIESLTVQGQGRGQQSGQAGQQGQGRQGQGQQGGQGGQQPGQGQQGQGGGQQGQSGQLAQGQAGGQRGGQGQTRGGDVGNRVNRGGGGDGSVDYNVNTGNNRFGNGQRVLNGPENRGEGGVDHTLQDGLSELGQLRQLAHGDPAAMKEIQDLVREMQKLDPSRFPGNPAMVEQLHTQVLQSVDKLELQLRRDANNPPSDQVRTGKTPVVPPGYQDAVAEYYRRLSKGQ
jgi:hypothetical protein